MSSSKSTIYLITGCGRGIGRALADLVLQRPDTLLIGLVRDPDNEASESLKAQPKATGSKVVLLKYTAEEVAAADIAVAELLQKHPEVDHIDVAIANAGVAQYFGPSLDASTDVYLDHLQINTLGPLRLFKAMLPLLHQKDADGPKAKFIAISSAGGSTGLMVSRGCTGALPYGMSKAALNHCIGRLRFEHPEIAFRILTPGATKTEFGGEKVDWSKMPHALTVEEVAPQLMKRIDEFVDTPTGALLEFRDWKGDTIPW